MPDTQPITIEKLVYEGPGLGRLENGQVVLVPWTVPEDEISITPGTKKPFAIINKIIKPSPQRITAKCSVFEICGGCNWQNMTYETQLQAKENMVIETLQRMGKITDPPVLSIMASAKQFEYRNHVVWHWDTEKLGYYQHQSNTIIPFENCELIPETINQLYHALPELITTIKKPVDLDIKWSSDNKIILTFMGEGKPSETLAQKIIALSPEIIGVCHQYGDDEAFQVFCGQSFLTETIDSYSFQVSSGSFFQVNNNAIQQVLETIKSWLPKNKAMTMLDAYAGVGLFSIALNNYFSAITAVESASSSTHDAMVNLQNNHIEHIDYHQQDIDDFLIATEDNWQVGIIDPPRGGCSPSVLNALNEKITDTIIYISCNPTTLARDLKHLLAIGSWKIESVQPYDFFPQTYHVETATLLKRI